jgi:hypothetical protein
MTTPRVEKMTLATLLAAVTLAAGTTSLRAQAAPPTPGLAAAPALWVETYGTMILHDRAAGPAKEITLTGVRNEVVAAQIALRAAQDSEKPCTFEWTALAGPGGKEIAKDNVTLFRAADIEVLKGSGENKSKEPLRSRPVGKFPDALVPLYLRDGTNVANAIKLEKDQTLAFWVDIHVPAGTPAGDYTGSITLKSDGPAISVPVKLTVRDIEIPADSSIPSLYNLRLHPHAAANQDNYVAAAMAHRLQPSNYGYLGLSQAQADKYNPNGKGWVSVYVSDMGPIKADKLAALKKTTAHLKERNLFERSFLQLHDEPKHSPREDDIPGVTAMIKSILQEVPEWKGKLMETISNTAGMELDPLLTVEVFTLRTYGPWSWTKSEGREEWDKRRANGQQLWFYVSNNQGTPYPTFDVDTPTVAFEPRVMAWAWWYEKAVGHLYWDLMFDPSWKLHGGNFPPGDGQLMYPGDFAGALPMDWLRVKDIKEPVVSRRMKVFRQGLQEWELLKLAEKKVGRDKVQAIVDPIYTCLGTKDANPAKPAWSYDEAAWDKARAAVLQLLDARP